MLYKTLSAGRTKRFFIDQLKRNYVFGFQNGSFFGATFTAKIFFSN